MNMKRKSVWKLVLSKSLFVVTLFSSAGILMAKEGVWLPPKLIEQEKNLRAAGLQMKIGDIYNEDGTGLNNAVVLFGRGCTGEIVSPTGLLLTNHHCGYGSAQSLSSAENDYFANGFWAKNLNEELPVKGLTVTFIRKIIDVTEEITHDLSDEMPDSERDSIIKSRIADAEKMYEKKMEMDATIKPYFKGNEYWLAMSETFRDIRFVGFPPNAIGAFGGDVENWAWPRHTGDFSVFRVYAGTDNRPADYHSQNKPYRTPKHFKINISGYKEGDFTMVYGFPGRTDEYISSYALKHVYEISDPISIEARTRKLDVYNKYMGSSREVFLKYTSKKGHVANGWKKWQGEVKGLKMNDAVGKKRKYESEFAKWAADDKSLPFADNLLPQMKKYSESADALIYEDRYQRETVLGIELVGRGAVGEQMMKCFRTDMKEPELRDTIMKIAQRQEGFYKNYDLPTDKDVFKTLMTLYFNKCANTLPEYYRVAYVGHNEDINEWAEDIYKGSMFATHAKLKAWAENVKVGDTAGLLADAVYQLYHEVMEERRKNLLPALDAYNSKMNYLERLYMKAQMKLDKNKEFYPDANLTLRLSYGKIQGLDPDGPPKYSYQTTLKDLVALDDPKSDIFNVPDKLVTLYKNKDYGRWGAAGSVPVAFLASNHTTGGNSGSPVLNAKGELIGTNFDRPYEGTMSDYYFDPNRCRNISVDIRYILFIIDKFGGAGWLVDEMDIVK